MTEQNSNNNQQDSWNDAIFEQENGGERLIAVKKDSIPTHTHTHTQVYLIKQFFIFRN
ncbi:MAG: hypothetical protein HZC14_02870 [Candidatus Niyogibacteria bacterium]|nr:hypothetical protein [Candidatus Niyogibacteria bacterium]